MAWSVVLDISANRLQKILNKLEREMGQQICYILPGYNDYGQGRSFTVVTRGETEVDFGAPIDYEKWIEGKET